MPDLSLNRHARIDVRSMGRERQPLVIVDNALTAPDDMVAIAAIAPFARPPHTLYPGLNAPVPPTYTEALQQVLRPLLKQVFSLPDNVPLDASSFFALATDGPDDLQPAQKVPHHDSGNPLMIAMVHYLCHPPHGGTGFFQHKTTGFEYVIDSRRDAYHAALNTELAGHLTQHAGRDTPNYERIDSADLVYNRLVIYRSVSLHSGLLESAPLTADPRTGRLTITSMMVPH